MTLEPRSKTAAQSLDCRHPLALGDCSGIQRPRLFREYEPVVLPHAAFPLWPGPRAFSRLACGHPKDGPLCRLLHLESALVSRLACNLSISCPALVDAVGRDFLFYDGPGGFARRVAPNLPSHAQRKSA